MLGADHRLLDLRNKELIWSANRYQWPELRYEQFPTDFVVNNDALAYIVETNMGQKLVYVDILEILEREESTLHTHTNSHGYTNQGAHDIAAYLSAPNGLASKCKSKPRVSHLGTFWDDFAYRFV
jgi:hypothetical protein